MADGMCSPTVASEYLVSAAVASPDAFKNCAPTSAASPRGLDRVYIYFV
jgi:hypothetical protein